MKIHNLIVDINPDVLLQDVGDSSVLLHLKTEHFYGLEGTARKMWDSITSTSNLEAAYQALIQEYDVDPQQLMEDLQQFVDSLCKAQLITVHS
jgi:hypothetical protein